MLINKKCCSVHGKYKCGGGGKILHEFYMVPGLLEKKITAFKSDG